jgi:hypothetical protein
VLSRRKLKATAEVLEVLDDVVDEESEVELESEVDLFVEASVVFELLA